MPRTISLACLLLLILPACPGDNDPAAPDAPRADAAPPDAGPPTSHAGLISIQDQSLHGVLSAGHGLSVLIDFTAPSRAPDFDEAPGELTGCKGWLYDVQDDPAPVSRGDEGVVTIAGTSATVPEGCRYEVGFERYACPTAGATGAATSVEPVGGPVARYTIAGVALTDADVGRYLRITGDAAHPGNDGRFPIVGVAGPEAALVANPAASASTYVAAYHVLAGGGAAGIPFDSPADPIRDDDAVVVGLEPGGHGDLAFADTAAIDAGAAFTLDTASAGVIGAVPVDGNGFTVGCNGAGGTCGPALLSVIQLESTDGPTAGASPFALPAAVDKKVVIQCAVLEGSIAVPAGAAALLRAADLATPITRVRLAFMRDGFALAMNPTGMDPAVVRVLVGHQLVGFTTDP